MNFVPKLGARIRVLKYYRGTNHDGSSFVAALPGEMGIIIDEDGPVVVFDRTGQSVRTDPSDLEAADSL